jgi:hypothetical protein
VSWLYTAPFALLAAVIVVSVVGTIELGRRLVRLAPVDDAQSSLIASPILAFVGLLLAFSFSMAGERMVRRRAAVLQETNAIGTFWLRTELVPDPTRSEMRARLQRYVALHVEHRHARIEEARTQAAERDMEELQRELWALAMADAARAPEANRQRLVLPALNDMLDAAAAAANARSDHLPDTVFAYLYMLVLASGIVVGYRPPTARPSLVLWGVFTLVVCGVLLVLLDMDRPRRGGIQNDMAPYLQLRDSMHERR